jgi:hypothetical protein
LEPVAQRQSSGIFLSVSIDLRIFAEFLPDRDA